MLRLAVSMRATRSALVGILAGGFAFASTASAQCQVCTLVVGVGVGLSRWLGIDDTISGIWIGGLMVSLVFATLGWMERKQRRFKGDWIVVAALIFLSLLAPLYFIGIIGQCANKLWGIDKLLLGTLVGSVLFFLGAWWYQRIKLRRGHAYFPFQKVVMPIAPLVVSSIVFYYVVK